MAARGDARQIWEEADMTHAAVMCAAAFTAPTIKAAAAASDIPSPAKRRQLQKSTASATAARIPCFEWAPCLKPAASAVERLFNCLSIRILITASNGGMT